MNFFIQTFGCQMNINDSEKMRSLLTAKGFVQCDNSEDADLLIINTCAVREKPQEKVYSYAGRIKKKQKLIVCGCVAQLEKKKLLKRSQNVSYVVGTHAYYEIAKIADEVLKEGKRGVDADFHRQWHNLVPNIECRDSNISAYVSIMEGCNNFCTYCVVPFTRSREKHRSLNEIMKEVEILSKAGYKEIILLGQNVNSWKDQGLNFVDLLDKVAKNSSADWIRFITSYPGYHNRALPMLMKNHSNLVRHIHFPAQSGSDNVLKLMRRKYNLDEYMEMINEFKETLPDIKFSSDFIVGFPQETEDDFLQTLDLIKEVEYDSIFSFIYSPRPYSYAKSMPGHLPEDVKKERLYRLQKLQADIQLKKNKEMIGRDLDVLIVGKNSKREQEMIGRTESYKVVNLLGEAKEGEIIKVKVTGAGPHSLRAKKS